MLNRFSPERQEVSAISSPYDFFTAQNVAILITAVAAVATTYMAIATRRMGDATKQLATATENSVTTATLSLEREKDSLMPLLDLTWTIEPEKSVHGRYPFRFGVRNVGSGPAFIHEITVRNEVNRFDVYHCRLRRAILAPGVEMTDAIEPEAQYVLTPPRWSSVSVWYRDVYDRWYRSRLLLRYEQPAVDGPSASVTMLTREFRRVPGAPPFAWETAAQPEPDRPISLAEGGRCIPFNPLVSDEEWHSLTVAENIRQIGLPGDAVTGGEPIAIQGMGFWFENAWPQFVIQLGKHNPFVLGLGIDGLANRSPRDIRVVFTDQYPRAWARNLILPLPPDVDQLDWASFGLAVSPSVHSELFSLYNRLYVATRNTIDAVTSAVLP